MPNTTREQKLFDAYPSRCSDTTEFLPRLEPVTHAPAGDPPPSPLTPALTELYQRQGFLTLNNVFSTEEIAGLQAELERIRRDDMFRNRPEAITEKGSNEFRSLFAPHRLSPVFERLAAEPRLRDVARYLLGNDVYIHQARINLKPAFRGNGFYWHSDFETWHTEDGMPQMRALSMSVSLTENNHFNGPLQLIPGSHTTFVTCLGETPENNYTRSLKEQEIGVPDDDSLADLVRKGGGIEASIGPAGSVTIFDCNTMHGSGNNISPIPRSNAFFVYNAVSNQLTDPFCGKAPRPEYIATRADVSPL